MNFKELAKKRESCREYSDKKLSQDDIMDIISTAMQSPSACNSQPWRFVVCEGDVAQKMPTCIIDDALPINKWVGEADAYVVLCEMPAVLRQGKISQKYAQMDVGMACATFCLAAADKGIATCILGSFNEEKVKGLLNIPSDITVRLVITMGYAKTESPRAKTRKALDEIASVNKW